MVLHIQFFGYIYLVAITHCMDIHTAMEVLKELVPGKWDAHIWAMFGLAADEAGEAWKKAQWTELKSK